MLYDLSNILDRERFKRRSNELFKKERLVELTEKKEPRTLDQNAYLHAILSYFALEYGETMEYVKQKYFKELCNPDMFVIVKEDRFMGRTCDLRSSAALDTAQMSLAVERFRTWASKEAGIYIPTSEEHAFLKQIQVELSKNKQWL